MRSLYIIGITFVSCCGLLKSFHLKKTIFPFQLHRFKTLNEHSNPIEIFAGIKEYVRTLPDNKSEAWKMLSLENIFSLQTEYNGGNSGNSELPVENDTIVDFSAYVEEANSNVIIFLNNKLCTNLSKIDESCGVLHKCNIHTISNYYPSFRNTIEDVFEPNDKIGSDLLFSIQQKFGESMYVLQVNTTTKYPLQIIHLYSNESFAPISPSIFIDVINNSSISLLESFISIDKNSKSSDYLGSSVSINLHDSSVCDYVLSHELADHYKSTHIITANLAKNANLQLSTIQIGSAINRVNCNMFLDGKSSDAKALGLIIADSDQCLDMHSSIYHGAIESKSEQDQRIVLGGSSKGIFRGSIHIPSASKESSARQLSRSLLIGYKPRIRTLPILKVSAQDVTCSHGSTVSEIDENSLFYMESRGIGKNEAKQILMKGFVRDITTKMSNKYENLLRRVDVKLNSLSILQQRVSEKQDYLGM